MSEKNNQLSLSQDDMTSSQNYGKRNISAVRAAMAQDRQCESRSKKVYTLIQINSPCEVNVTNESRKVCAKALFK